MPAPYPLLISNVLMKLTFAPRKMTAAHNTFIQGINAIVHHAPTVNEDNSWCSALQCSAISTIITSSKKRKGTLSESIEQHKDFLPGVEALEEWCKKVQKSKEVYDANVLLGLEISTLDRDVIQAKFTIAELDAIEAEFKKRALGLLDIYTSLPMSLRMRADRCALAVPLKWATRWWYSSKHSEAWEFGPMDFSGKERVKF
ncbi:hypothetical protein BYT27DRAFT_7246497 [Phlegmacium glaucopus]|nr:hypothetical protein BYT27DRAFT_7246497 [Phlegmacium glaucopus]